MKLYYAPQTRAIRPLIMLEELDVPYEIVLIDFKSGEHKSVSIERFIRMDNYPPCRTVR